MQIWEIFFMGAALAMDAVAASLTNGMAEPAMSRCKPFLIAGVFALFQFAMPLVGYYFSGLISDAIRNIAPWLSFLLLALVGGKSIFDGIEELLAKKRGEEASPKPAGPVKLLAQGVATSLDALAVGVTLLAVETTSSLPFSAPWCALVIGGVTFVLSFAAVFVGKKAGDRFGEKAEIAGGVILLVIGIKILLEGLL